MAKKTKDSNLSLEERLEQALIPNWDEPYKLPENWCWTTIKQVAEIVTGGTPSKKNPEYYGESFPFFKPADLDAGRSVRVASEYLSEKGKAVARIIPAKSTAVCCIGSIGKSGYLEVDGTTNQQINSAIPKINPLYLYYYVNTDFFTNQLWQKSSATTISIVNKSKMEECTFPLCPTDEQQRIVDRIETLFAKLDEAKEKAQEVVDGYESRKAAILHKAFSGELTAKWREENGVDIESWQQIVLGDYADSQYGYTESSSFELIGPKFLRITDIQNGQVDWKSVPYCKIAASDKEKYSLKFGDIVVARTGATTGKSYLIVDEVDAVYASYLIRVSIKSHDLINSYLYTFMQSPNYWQQISELSSGIAQPGVNGKKLQKLELPLPIAHEQLEIVSICENLLSKESRAKEIAEAVIEQIDAMKKAILARAFRGELGTNDPSEESAVELLKKIL